MMCNVFGQDSARVKLVDASNLQPITTATFSTGLNSHIVLFNEQGNYKLFPFSKNDSLQVFALGYHSKQVALQTIESVIHLTPQFTALHEIVISGSRLLQKKTDVPAAIDVISAKTINETKAVRLDQLLNKTAGVFMVDLGNEQHSMSVRQPLGYKNLFLYLEDGIPIRTTGDFNHNALIEINHAAIERIDILKGPASSLFGSEAVGAAINFITAKPTPYFSGKWNVEAGSRGFAKTTIQMSHTLNKWGVYLAGSHARQNQSLSEHNDFQKTAFTFRADYPFNEKLKISNTVAYIHYHTDQKGGLDSARFYSKDYESVYRFSYRKVKSLRMIPVRS